MSLDIAWTIHQGFTHMKKPCDPAKIYEYSVRHHGINVTDDWTATIVSSLRFT
jgi:hypothetical protein